MGKFKIPTVSSTTNKTVRFPNNKIDRVDKAIQGKDCTFPAFVISAFRAALKKYDKDESGNVRKEYKFRLRKKSVEEECDEDNKSSGGGHLRFFRKYN